MMIWILESIKDVVEEVAVIAIALIEVAVDVTKAVVRPIAGVAKLLIK